MEMREMLSRARDAHRNEAIFLVFLFSRFRLVRQELRRLEQ
jgi:hypothetical protein